MHVASRGPFARIFQGWVRAWDWRPFAEATCMKKPLDYDKVAEALGAKRGGPFPAKSGFFGALQTAAEFQAQRAPTTGKVPLDEDGLPHGTVVFPNGHSYAFKHGLYEGSRGSVKHFFGGVLHQATGPAVVYDNGDLEWWVNGRHIDVKTQEEFEEYLRNQTL